MFYAVLEHKMPEGEKPVIPPPPAIHVERTLALIKPDAIHKSDEIEEIILQHGFTILQVQLYAKLITFLVCCFYYFDLKVGC